jgi:hypothetical protein
MKLRRRLPSDGARRCLQTSAAFFHAVETAYIWELAVLYARLWLARLSRRRTRERRIEGTFELANPLFQFAYSPLKLFDPVCRS